MNKAQIERLQQISDIGKMIIKTGKYGYKETLSTICLTYGCTERLAMEYLRILKNGGCFIVENGIIIPKTVQTP
jgi:hypothetical protein